MPKRWRAAGDLMLGLGRGRLGSLGNAVQYSPRWLTLVKGSAGSLWWWPEAKGYCIGVESRERL